MSGPPAAMTGAQAREWATASKLDWAAIGFRCGLEIHQQLDTRKLFSPCPSDVIEPDEVAGRTIAAVDRRLRATASELGEVDVAALAEARKGLAFRYLAISGLTSLVELDEEPPHPLCEEALDVALTFAGLLGSRPAAEVHVMRKTVIDGSNTSGFQRTALIATGGRIEAEGGPVGIWTVALEEDSARKLDDPKAAPPGVVAYTLDRLGIPLIEVATAPDIRDPAHAQRAAARLGALLRATGRVKRGLGTIRQDLNVSVAVGERVEIKGCQDLRAIPRVIEAECRRQLWLHHVRMELSARKADPAAVREPADATATFTATGAKVVAEAVRNGGRVLALRLPGFAGLLKGATKDGPRLGRELADHAKVAAGVKGVFHSDELPAYGIADAEVAAVRTLLGCQGGDAFVLCAAAPSVAARALHAVAERARQAMAGPRSEVRATQPDDSTRYMRPMPGAARMYPETDVPPIRIAAARWQATLKALPPTPEEKVAAFVRSHGLSQDIATQVVREGLEADLGDLVAAGADASLAARVLLQHLPVLKDPESVRPRVGELLSAQGSGAFAKEAIPQVLAVLDAEPRLALDAALAKAGVAPAGAADVDAVVRRVVAERADFVRQRGMGALGPLMGPVMAELRGKVDGQVISARLKAEIERVAKA